MGLAERTSIFSRQRIVYSSYRNAGLGKSESVKVSGNIGHRGTGLLLKLKIKNENEKL